MDVVRGWVTLMRKKDRAEPCLFSYLSYKEDVVKYGQLGDRFTAGYRGGI